VILIIGNYELGLSVKNTNPCQAFKNTAKLKSCQGELSQNAAVVFNEL
jgi:hypothetical protein